MSSDAHEHNQWSKVDRLELKNREYLNPEDECFYYMTLPNRHVYTGGVPWGSPARSQMMNLKKPIEQIQSHPNLQRYKVQAINQFASDVAEILQRSAGSLSKQKTAIVPMPPSKSVCDPNYDDRIVRVCQIAQAACDNVNLDYVDCIQSKKTRPSAHSSGNRLTPAQHIANLTFNNSVLQAYETVLLVDDTLTLGATFSACKQLICQVYPDMRVVGLFWAIYQ